MEVIVVTRESWGRRKPVVEQVVIGSVRNLIRPAIWSNIAPDYEHLAASRWGPWLKRHLNRWSRNRSKWKREGDVQGVLTHNWKGARRCLAGLLLVQDDLAGGRRLLERGLAIYETALGPEHPNTGAALRKLISPVLAQGRLTRASALLQPARSSSAPCILLRSLLRLVWRANANQRSLGVSTLSADWGEITKIPQSQA